MVLKILNVNENKWRGQIVLLERGVGLSGLQRKPLQRPTKVTSSLVPVILQFLLHRYKVSFLCPNKYAFWGFPGGSEVKNPPAKAGDMGSVPGLGRSHMPRSSCLSAPTVESVLQSLVAALLSPCSLVTVLCKERSHLSEKPQHCSYRAAPSC